MRPGRVEVTYATFTDGATGLGGWIHRETVAPADGAAPYAHGWAAVFRAGLPPVVERFGADGADVLRGEAGALQWELKATDDSPPLYTFPRLVWERELLPGAQIVPQPSARFAGTIVVDGEVLGIDARGAVARIKGHGSAQRWGWLHADLGSGAVLEIVTATAHRPGLRRVPPLALVQLRLPGEADWPAKPLLAAVRFRTRLRADGFSVRGGRRRRRLEVDVELPASQRVALTYTDPDGSTATCTNSERAVATITLHDRRAGTRRWHLDGTAHAEVGARP